MVTPAVIEAERHYHNVALYSGLQKTYLKVFFRILGFRFVRVFRFSDF